MENMKIKYGKKNIYSLLGYTTSHDIKTFLEIHISLSEPNETTVSLFLSAEGTVFVRWLYILGMCVCVLEPAGALRSDPL